MSREYVTEALRLSFLVWKYGLLHPFSRLGMVVSLGHVCACPWG